MKVACSNCRHYRRAPYEAPHTGCWHPENMVTAQKERFLDQQQLPGDAAKLNLHGDCPRYEAKPTRPSLVQRILRMGL